MATHRYLDNYPSNHNPWDPDWSGGLQGVTHDSEHWFFTQEKKLWKFHVTKDLNANSLTPDAKADMPDELTALGCDHFGDPDHFVWNDQGYLFIPVEGANDCGKQPIVAVFRNDRDELPYIGHTTLELQNDNIKKGRIGWCAISPVSRLLHTSYNEINAELPIFRYEIVFEALENGDVILNRESDLKLWETSAEEDHVHIPTYVQGGAFSPDGVLYISSGKLTKLQPPPTNGKPLLWALAFFPSLIAHLFEEDNEGGIFVFDVSDDDGIGILQDRSSLTDMPFKYEYHSGFWKYEEPEGLTFWDIDGLNLQVPGVEGQLHAILLDTNVWPFDDEIFIKHYRIE